jgi:hypothetical protein
MPDHGGVDLVDMLHDFLRTNRESADHKFQPDHAHIARPLDSRPSRGIGFRNRVEQPCTQGDAPGRFGLLG